MSVHLKHLNADATFLLTFTSSATPDDGSSDSIFTVLTDPWLADAGAPQYHPKFAYAARKIPAHVSHLSQIPPPDVIVISQDKTDHCHEATLRQLSADLPYTTILAHPDAAKKIRSWRYFRADKVHALLPYSDKNHNTVVRFSIPANTPGGVSGEATITLIKQTRDITKLHNAIAITYRPPSSGLPSFIPTSPTIVHIPSIHARRSQPNLSQNHHSFEHQLRSMLSTQALNQHLKEQPQPEPSHTFPKPPLTPPDTPPESEEGPQERPRNLQEQSRTPRTPKAPTSTSPRQNFHLRHPSDSLPYASPKRRSRALSSPKQTVSSRPSSSSASNTQQRNGRPYTSDGRSLPPSLPAPTSPLPPLPSTASLPQAPISPFISPFAPLTSRTSASTSGRTTARASVPKTISVLYAPHGISYGSLRPYASHHLVCCAALPLTLLLHPFTAIDNPWWFGGNVSTGVPGGVQIAERLMVGCWVGTHDEVKEESGLGLSWIKKGVWTLQDVRNLLGSGEREKQGRRSSGRTFEGNARQCEVLEMRCGEDLQLRP